MSKDERLIIDLRLDNSLGDEDLYEKRETFNVSSIEDETVLDYAIQLEREVTKQNGKFIAEGIDIHVYIVVTINGKTETPLTIKFEEIVEKIL